MPIYSRFAADEATCFGLAFREALP